MISQSPTPACKYSTLLATTANPLSPSFSLSHSLFDSFRRILRIYVIPRTETVGRISIRNEFLHPRGILICTCPVVREFQFVSLIRLARSPAEACAANSYPHSSRTQRGIRGRIQRSSTCRGITCSRGNGISNKGTSNGTVTYLFMAASSSLHRRGCLPFNEHAIRSDREKLKAVARRPADRTPIPQVRQTYRVCEN